MAEIYRLIPADIYKIQQQTADNAAVLQVIEALQSNASTVEEPLNTNCPTCEVEGDATGFVLIEFQGQEFKKICPTCNGNLMYYTAEGAETPPVNPFEDDITSNRKPADFLEALNAFDNVSTLDLLNTALIGNVPVVLSHNCPLCEVDGESTGTITVQSEPTSCTLCMGYQKTYLEYQMVDGEIEVVTPTIPPPDPIPPLPPIS